MAYKFPPDVERAVEAWKASGRYDSTDDVLRDALQALSEQDDDLEAVREAVAALRAGDPGVPVAEVFEKLRKKHGLSGEE